MANNVKYKISLEDKFSKGLDNANKKVSSFDKKIVSLGKTIGGIFAAKMLIKGVTNLTNLWDIQAQAIAQVAQGIKSTGGVAGRTLNQLEKQASNLQDETIFGDEDILKNVTAQLLTFTNVSGKNFDRLQLSALNLSARLGTDLKSSAIQLGKALNDPVANLSALSRSGIQFSKQQKTVIKTLTETGRLAEAQSLILDELEKQFGGSAKAARKAGKGGFKALSNTLGDLGEVIGERLLRSSGDLAGGLEKLTKSAISLVKIGVPERLRAEQLEATKLIAKLRDSNIKEEDRLSIIQRLNAISPTLTKGLDAENLSINQLTTNLRAFNKQQAKKLVLASLNEDEQKLIAKDAIRRGKIEKALYGGGKSTHAGVGLKREQISQLASDDLFFKKTRISQKRYLTVFDSFITAVNDGNLDVAKQKIKNNKDIFIAGTGDMARTALRQVRRINRDAGKQIDIAKRISRFEKELNLDDKNAGGLDGNGNVTAIAGKELKAGIQTITAAAPKTFNINIDKFVENFSVSSETITESTGDVRDKFVEMWIKMLADVQAVGG